MLLEVLCVGDFRGVELFLDPGHVFADFVPVQTLDIPFIRGRFRQVDIVFFEEVLGYSRREKVERLELVVFTLELFFLEIMERGIVALFQVTQYVVKLSATEISHGVCSGFRPSIRSL